MEISQALLQDKNRENVGTELKTNITKRISKPFSSQDARFFFRVHFEHSLPCFKVDHEELEIVKRYP